MSYKGLSGGQYKPLSENDVEVIHQASLEILEKTGFTFEAGLDETLAMLESAGAIVDRKPDRVYFPRDLILAQAAKAPSQVTLYSRDGLNDLNLTEDRVHLGTGGAAVNILDLESGDPRPSTLSDLYQLGRLVDNLVNIHFFLRPCIPTDIAEDQYDVNTYYACLKSTAKHVMSGVNDVNGLHQVIDLAATLVGGKDPLQARPFVSVITSFAISPLKALYPVHPDYAGSYPKQDTGGPFGSSHVRLHFTHNHGRDPGTAACRATGRYLHLPADQSRCTALIRRNPGAGQSCVDGLSGGCGGMRNDECRRPPAVKSYPGTQLQFVRAHRFKNTGCPGGLGKSRHHASGDYGRFQFCAPRGRDAGIHADRCL